MRYLFRPRIVGESLSLLGVNWQFPDLSLACNSSCRRLVINGPGFLRFSPGRGPSTQSVADSESKKPPGYGGFGIGSGAFSQNACQSLHLHQPGAPSIGQLMALCHANSLVAVSPACHRL